MKYLVTQIVGHVCFSILGHQTGAKHKKEEAGNSVSFLVTSWGGASKCMDLNTYGCLGRLNRVCKTGH
jgi:hypothetical protein